MRRVQYRQWCPRESPLRIEIAEDLLRELSPQPEALETLGILYGLRHGNQLRVLGTKPEAGQTALGVFVCRERGEVFLTESNLASMQKQGVAMALVIAGNRAGFFVHAPGGTIQTVRSYEEFGIAEPEQQAPAARPTRVPAPTSSATSRKWTWAVAGWMLLLALPVAALAYLRPAFPLKPATPQLRVQEENGQVKIRWRSGSQAILEIQDGGERTAVPVFGDQASATYQRRSAEIEVSLIHFDGRSTRRESTRLLGPAPPESPRDQLYSDIAHIRERADQLRTESSAHRARIASLQRAIARRVTR